MNDSLREIRAVLDMYFCQNPGKPPLATFKAEASFDTWFWGTKKGAAMRQVFRYYDSMGFVRPRRLSSGNTKLRILHLPLDKREYIVDLVAVPEFHEVLVKVYVEKKKLDVVREEMGYPEQYGIRSTAVDNIKSRFEARIVSYLKKKMKSYLREA